MKIILDNPVDALCRVNDLISYQHYLLVEMSGGACFPPNKEEISGHWFLLEIQQKIIACAVSELESVNKL